MAGTPVAHHIQAGRHAEAIASAYLQARGLLLLACNYRCRMGELDLIMTDDQCLVIVEVRYRKNDGIVSPLQSIGSNKIRRLARTTRHFLQHHRELQDMAIRFDVVAMTGFMLDPVINWVKNAFELDGLC